MPDISWNETGVDKLLEEVVDKPDHHASLPLVRVADTLPSLTGNLVEFKENFIATAEPSRSPEPVRLEGTEPYELRDWRFVGDRMVSGGPYDRKKTPLNAEHVKTFNDNKNISMTATDNVHISKNKFTTTSTPTSHKTGTAGPTPAT